MELEQPGNEVEPHGFTSEETYARVRNEMSMAVEGAFLQTLDCCRMSVGKGQQPVIDLNEVMTEAWEVSGRSIAERYGGPEHENWRR